MKRMRGIGLALAVLSADLSVGAAGVECPAGRLEVDDATGRLVGVWAAGSDERLVTSGAKGLWRLGFAKGGVLSAREAKFLGATKTSTGLRLAWTHARADVTLVITTDAAGFTFTGEVACKEGTVLEFEHPADLRFDPSRTARFVSPHTRIDGYGYGFAADYFRRQTDRLSGWETKWLDGRGWHRLFNNRLPVLRASDAPAEPVTVTEEGKRYLSKETVTFLEKAPVAVLRPPQPGQYDVAWSMSKSGPLIAGTHFGGTGTFWRVSTWGDNGGRETVRKVREGYLDGLVRAVAATAGARKKLGYIRLLHGVTDSMTFRPELFVDKVRRAAEAQGLVYVELETPQAIAAAESSGEFAAIVNPYDEHLATETVESFDAAVDAVRDYVRAGGNWIECGGASFFMASVPNRYYARRILYPTCFLDLQRLETVAGQAVTLYGVQPRLPHAPWQAKRRFQVGILACGGDADGGYFLHGHQIYVKAGERYAPPSVRLRLGGTLDTVLAEYSAANTLTRTLADKVRPETLEKLTHGVFLKLGGTAKELRAVVPELPPSTTVHLACYLKGNFDKEYPDHLPCRPGFGTMAEFRALIDELHAAGHLFSPYTNPTWWCDHPRGPSFVAAGEAPLLRKLSGELQHEVYGQNDGWTVTFWHPAVQAANRRTVRAFTEDLPCDLLFQDQTGGRGSGYDLNPASPAPDAYGEGLLSQIDEDSARVPLGCEDGWDQVANRDLAIFGTTFKLIPLKHKATQEHEVLIKNSIPPDLWTIEPLSAKLMHDKTLFYLHDLGEFVWDRRGLAWCVALGINLSYTLYMDEWKDPRRQAWLKKLAHIQREAVSRLAGRKLTGFVHDRAPLFARKIDPTTRDDDGTIVSTWGDIVVRANLGDVPRTIAGEAFEPYGWSVRWPGGALTSRQVFDASKR